MVISRAENAEIKRVQKTPKNRKAKEPTEEEIHSPTSLKKVEVSM